MKYIIGGTIDEPEDTMLNILLININLNSIHWADVEYYISFFLIWLPWPDSMLIIGWFFQTQNSGYPVTKLCT